jgi:hypothetical protein
MPIKVRDEVNFEINTGKTVEPAIKARAAMKNVPFRIPNVKLRFR